MREQGFISNRIFDALASGAVVVSDRVAGMEETFGDLVPTYADGDELNEIVWRILEDGQRRREISQSASALVAREHTFERRAQELVDLLGPLLAGRRPTWTEANDVGLWVLSDPVHNTIGGKN